MEMLLKGLDCPHCAEKIRSAAEKHVSVEKAEMNFMAQRLTLLLKDGADENAVYSDIVKIIKSAEPDVEPTIINKHSHEHNHDESCGENPCEHRHSDYSEEIKAPQASFTLILEELDCPECGEKIRSYAEKMNGVEKAELNLMTKKLKITLSSTGKESTVTAAVTGFVNTVEPDVKVIKAGSESVSAKAVKKEGMISGRTAARLAVSALFFAAGMIFRSSSYALFLFLAGYIIIGLDVVIKAAANILKGRAFDECFLMTIATLGAFFVGEYPEGVAVMFLYQLGEMFQSYAVRRSRNSISELMDIRPDSANVKRKGEVITCSPEDVQIGEIIVIKPGEKIPLDSIVVSGSSAVDVSALTGESVPRSVREGDEILSGCINLNGLIEARTSREYGESTVSKILELVENSAAKKAKTENFITRFAKIYTPCVVIAAILLAVVPMIIKRQYDPDFLYRALSFLVVSCPCALVISVPLSFFSGIGGASKRGILVKGGICLENLAKCDTVVFDKTGTLTEGVFAVSEVSPVNMSEDELVRFAAYAESASNHPAARSIMNYYGVKVPENIAAEEISGKGVKAVIDDKTILVGSAKLMNENKITGIPSVKNGGTIVYIAVCGNYAGYIRISDKIKADSKSAVAALKKAGIHTVMLTGDRMESAEAAAAEIGVDEYSAELLPTDKVSSLEGFMEKSDITAFVGDGINDAPVLMRADVGIAMGAIGSDAAIEAADIVLMTDEPSKINEAIAISKKTCRIVTENIVFALGVKLLILILTALGITSMWIAVFGDVGVAFIAIINAMRARNCGFNK